VSGSSHWYQDAVFYQIRVASFYDSDGDGVGDLPGLTRKLDYIADLGVTTLWLLPFYPSPRRDDGYDIADYTAVHPDYGTLRDFKVFLREAHRRNLRVVTEMVLNHTSDQHAWFQRARRAPKGSRYRDFYVWSDDPHRYEEARIIFKDFETSNWTWDPVAEAYYWHRFYSHQPDLNFDNPEVQRAVIRALDFWLEMGVDGVRLDAVPYLYEREGTSCENLPETHAFLRELRAHVDREFSDRMLLAEANQWPEDAVAYFGKGDECNMAFHFPVMPRLFMALHMEDRSPILDILEQTPPIPPGCQWALFLRNHDELTLEMVTDEERDYMWRVYAREERARINLGIRRRLGPLLDNNRRRIELLNALLLSMPGTPIVYYGDEIGMGDNVYLGDRDAVRTPMQWSADRNAGFSRANPQKLVLPVITDPEYHFDAVNVENQETNTSSLLWWMKRILRLRKRHRAFGHGSFEPLTPTNRRVLAFLRRTDSDTLLVVANLSRFAQYVELDLSEFAGARPRELFGQTEFPRIGELPYLLTLGPHSFYWFDLATPEEAGEPKAVAELPRLEARESWATLLESSSETLSEALTPYLWRQRWFRSKGRQAGRVRIQDALELESSEIEARIALVQVDFREGTAETYVVPLCFRAGAEPSDATIARLRVVQRGGAEETGTLDEASGDPRFADALADLLGSRRRLRGRTSELRGVPTRFHRELLRAGPLPEGRLLGAEQSNTSFLFGDRLVGKLLRRVDEGESCDLEISRALSGHFEHTPRLAGHLALSQHGEDDPATFALFHAFVSNEGDAWEFTLDGLQLFLGEVRARSEELGTPHLPDGLLGEAADELRIASFNGHLEMVHLLGRRTGELHAALAAAEGPAFEPEPLTPFRRRAQYQSMRNLAVRVLERLGAARDGFGRALQAEADDVLARSERIHERLRDAMEHPRRGRLIRCHGDYHLGQVLYRGNDFAIIDFEGEPARSPAERRRKRFPLVDVAGMLRSFHYAAESALDRSLRGGGLRAEDEAFLRPWMQRWTIDSSRSFLSAYLEAVAPSGVLPGDPAELAILLDLFLLEKALYELGYELDNRPDWVHIPLRGLQEILSRSSGGSPQGSS
jgi:maltose alpha-D-glucosyltransferase/alpha-amylase